MVWKRPNILLPGLIVLLSFVLLQCGSKQANSDKPMPNDVNIGDIFKVGDKTINIYKEPDRKSDIIDMQEKESLLTVLDVKPEWAQLQLNSPGLLREEQGPFKGWAQIDDLLGLMKTRSVISKTGHDYAVSGRRAPSDKKVDPASVSGRKPRSGQQHQENLNHLCGEKGREYSDEERKAISGMQSSSSSAYDNLQELQVKVKVVKEVTYKEIVSNAKAKSIELSDRYLLGLKDGWKLVIVQFDLTNPNYRVYPTTPSNWRLQQKSDPAATYNCKRPHRIYPEARFKYPGGLIQSQQTVQGGLAFIVPETLKRADMVLINQPRGKNVAQEYSL